MKRITLWKQKLRKYTITLWAAIATTIVLPMTVFAEGDSANYIQESELWKSLMKMLQDAGIVMLIAAPILCGILIGIFALIEGANSEPHDKEKWKKNKKTVLIVLIWVFAASGVVAIIGSYFK